MLLQRVPAPVDVRLHLRQRHPERVRDCLITHVFEMEQDEWHTLMVGETPQRDFEPILAEVYRTVGFLKP